MIKETSCMKCSNLIRQTHQQTLQYHITFQMMKIMFNTHKIITNNKHLVCFQNKKYFKKLCDFRIKENKVCIETQVDHQVAAFGHPSTPSSTPSSTPCFHQVNITTLMIFHLFRIFNIYYN